jgi:hypothetical protein
MALDKAEPYEDTDWESGVEPAREGNGDHRHRWEGWTSLCAASSANDMKLTRDVIETHLEK